MSESFFPPCANTVHGYLFASLPKKSQNLGQIAIANGWSDFLLQWVQCSRVYQSMWVMQCMFPPSFPEFSRLNYESHWVWWIAPWLKILRSGWFDAPKQMGVQSFNICRWWFRWDCLLYSKMNWAQLYFFIDGLII